MKQRDTSIDLLRGLAIVTMIAANMAAHSLVEPHSFFMRICGSLAAPLFIFLAGMMVSYTLHSKQHPLSYYLKRGGLTILMAALIDVFVWGVFPFSTFDVLYVIGLGMPLIYFFVRLAKQLQGMLILLIFAVTPVLQYFFGYIAYPVELSVFEMQGFEELGTVPFAQQFFIDGWFPVFPWLGVSFLGAYIGTMKQVKREEQVQRNLLIAGSTLFGIGVVLWLFFCPELYSNEGFIETARSSNLYTILLSRGGYSELFYPPTLYYFCVYLGLIFLSLPLFRKLQDMRMLQFLSVFGRSSLLVYILHTVFIAFVFNQMDTYTALPFLGLYALHSVVLWLICWGVRQGTKGKQLPFLVRFVLGT